MQKKYTTLCVRMHGWAELKVWSTSTLPSSTAKLFCWDYMCVRLNAKIERAKTITVLETSTHSEGLPHVCSHTICISYKHTLISTLQHKYRPYKHSLNASTEPRTSPCSELIKVWMQFCWAEMKDVRSHMKTA